MYRWKQLQASQRPRGLRYFLDEHSHRIAVADESGSTPDKTDGGVSWLDYTRPLKLSITDEHVSVPTRCVETKLPTHVVDTPEVATFLVKLWLGGGGIVTTDWRNVNPALARALFAAVTPPIASKAVEVSAMEMIAADATDGVTKMHSYEDELTTPRNIVPRTQRSRARHDTERVVNAVVVPGQELSPLPDLPSTTPKKPS